MNSLLLMALSFATGITSLLAAPVGSAFTYQGRLTDANGTPANGTLPMAFALWDAATGGNTVGTPASLSRNVTVANGAFTTDLDFGSAVFSGEARWLEISVNGAVQSLRTRVSPTPNAIYASTAGAAITVNNASIQANHLGTVGAPATAGQVLSYNGTSLVWQNPGAGSGGWVVGGNNAAPGNFLGTLNNLPLQLKANNARGLSIEPNATSPNLIGGWGGNLADGGVFGATVGGGGAATQFGFGASNRVSDHFGTIGGGANNLAGNVSSDPADAIFATVGGGYNNRASSFGSTIPGGLDNAISIDIGAWSTIGGGYGNLVEAGHAVIAGGLSNGIGEGADDSIILAGRDNRVLRDALGSVVGGIANTNAAIGGAILSGSLNRIGTNSEMSVIAGGSNNVIEANARRAFIAAGTANRVLDGAFNSVILGIRNTNGGGNASIGGGLVNRIDAGAAAAAIGGGGFNAIQQAAQAAVIAGGGSNSIGTGAETAAIGGGIRTLLERVV